MTTFVGTNQADTITRHQQWRHDLLSGNGDDVVDGGAGERHDFRRKW